jgi:hypothetical protein
MSRIEQFKLQLHRLADQSRPGAGSLAVFKQGCEQADQHGQALISGSATGYE